MEVMNRALKGDPQFADVLKQMRAVQVLGGYTDQTAEGIQARVNNSFVNNGFAFQTKANQVAVLATGDQQVEGAKEVKGTTIRETEEKVVEQLTDGVIVQIGDKYYRKTSSYDDSNKVRTTYVQEWNKDEKDVTGAKTAYFQKRSEDGKLRGELVKVTLGGDASEQEKALKKAKEVALDKKKTLKEVGSAKHDYQPSNSQAGTMPTKEGFNWGTVFASAGAGAATGAAIGGTAGSIVPVIGNLTVGASGAVIGTVVGGTVGLVAAATGDKNQVKRSTPVPKESSASASTPTTSTPATNAKSGSSSPASQTTAQAPKAKAQNTTVAKAPTPSSPQPA